MTATRDREKAQKLAQKTPTGSTNNSRVPTPAGTPVKNTKKASSVPVRSTPTRRRSLDQQQLDVSGLNLEEKESSAVVEELPKMTFAREKLLEEVKRINDAQDERKGVSVVVIGHVDAGKSTLLGRLMYELGELDEKIRRANERGSSSAGKSSFSWAWGLDGTTEERERGITMDIALRSLKTTHRQITVLDAPGHKDFIPNMISGASQADCALLVVDATTGEFEAGFEKGGQTREHLLLTRSLGVAQVIVAINKLDQVEWSESRYEEICAVLRPFLAQSGFHPSKTKFVPVGAMQGINLLQREGADSSSLREWYSGPTLVDFLDQLDPPARDVTAPLRIPISNVFKGQGSGAVAVSGRLIAGIVQTGERLRVLPGDESAIVKSIEVEDKFVPWAAAGSNATLNLSGIEAINLGIGSVLCPLTDLIPLATVFTARIIVFDIQVPITAGTSVELHHHSRDVPATTLKLISTIDRSSGNVIKSNPRVLTKGTSAEVQIGLRPSPVSNIAGRGIPLEPFSVNKDMGRILIRRAGETIAAGIVLEVIS